MPPPFDPDRARPRAIIYVHLSDEALTTGTGVARVEDVGPVLLGRLRLLLGDRCSISLKPVIDLPAGHIPVDAYETPASLREQLLLRNPRRRVPLRRRSHPLASTSTTPSPTSAPTTAARPAKPESATSDPTSAATTDTKPMAAGRSDNPNPAPGYGDHPTTTSTSSTPPAPTPSATPNSHKQSGAQRTRRRRWPADPSVTFLLLSGGSRIR